MSDLWAARDEDGVLHLFVGERARAEDEYVFNSDRWIRTTVNIFPDLKFSDGPIRVKVVPVEDGDVI